jgi:hypothetical protein
MEIPDLCSSWRIEIMVVTVHWFQKCLMYILVPIFYLRPLATEVLQSRGYLGKRTFDCISMLNIFIELGGSDLNIRISLRLFRLDSIVFSTPGSLSNENSKPSSPLDKGANEVFFENRHARSNSKKYLRQEYSKSKRKNMCRKFEPTSGVENTIESRRNSLKEMRNHLLINTRFARFMKISFIISLCLSKYSSIIFGLISSLPPSSMNMLSMLIQSKVRLPRYPSKDIDLKRELRHQNEREFFLEIVKDISNDLDLRSLYLCPTGL